jgi:hypothetical protein
LFLHITESAPRGDFVLTGLQWNGLSRGEHRKPGGSETKTACAREFHLLNS